MKHVLLLGANGVLGSEITRIDEKMNDWLQQEVGK